MCIVKKQWQVLCACFWKCTKGVYAFVKVQLPMLSRLGWRHNSLPLQPGLYGTTATLSLFSQVQSTNHESITGVQLKEHSHGTVQEAGRTQQMEVASDATSQALKYNLL